MTKTILVPLDGTDGAEAGLHWAVCAAQRSGSGLDLLTVVDSTSPDATSERARSESYLAELKLSLETAEMAVSASVETGSPQARILSRASAAELTVMTYGTRQWLFGGALDHMLKKMTRPLVVVCGRSGQRPAVEVGSKVLVAMDTGPHAYDVLPVADLFAHTLGMSLVLCHVIPPVGTYRGVADAPPGVANSVERSMDDARSFLAGAARRLGQNGRAVESVVAMGEVSREIVRLADQTQSGVVAMATRGTQTLSRILGSAAYGVLQLGRLPSLLVRTPTGNPGQIGE